MAAVADGCFQRGAVAVPELGNQKVGFGVFEERGLDSEGCFGALIAKVNQCVAGIVP